MSNSCDRPGSRRSMWRYCRTSPGSRSRRNHAPARETAPQAGQPRSAASRLESAGPFVGESSPLPSPARLAPAQLPNSVQARVQCMRSEPPVEAQPSQQRRPKQLRAVAQSRHFGIYEGANSRTVLHGGPEICNKQDAVTNENRSQAGPPGPVRSRQPCVTECLHIPR